MLIATGSEVELAMKVADALEAAGQGADVVSMPSWERFDAQADGYRADLLPADVLKVSIEAGVTLGWQRYTGNDGINIVQEDSTKFKLTSQTAEAAILELTASLSETKKVSKTIRVNFVSPDVATLATSPVTVLVSPGLDTSLDLFKAAHNPGNRALAISSISYSTQDGASLTANKIKGGFIRIRGNTANDTAGFVGIVNYKISDGSGTENYTASGQAFVYEMPDPISKAPVARRDSGRPPRLTVSALSALAHGA
mgnify:CR=1 FL=1